MSGHTLRKMGLILLTVGMIVGLSGCEGMEEELLMLMGTEWLTEHRGTAARKALTGSTGDPEVDAALEPWGAIAEINEADQLMEVGRKNRNLELMEQAMIRRPRDWSYRLSYAALLLEQGDVNRADAQLQEVHTWVWVGPPGPTEQPPASPRDLLREANQGIAELEAVKDRLADRSMTGAQCRVLFNNLAVYYRARGNLTGSAIDISAGERYEEDAKRCAQ